MRINRLALCALLALLLLAVSTRAAQDIGTASPTNTMPQLDDAALASHPRILIATAVSSTQTSVQFTNLGYQKGLWFTMNITVCTACNVTFKVLALDQSGLGLDGALILPAAVSSTGSFQYFIGPTASGNGGPNNFSGISPFPVPTYFKVQVVWNSGTNATYTVTGAAW